MRDKAAMPAALRRRWQGSLSEGAVSHRLTEGVTLSEGAAPKTTIKKSKVYTYESAIFKMQRGNRLRQ